MFTILGIDHYMLPEQIPYFMIINHDLCDNSGSVRCKHNVQLSTSLILDIKWVGSGT